jgi:Leucine-rich repeat (LRR) protein
MNELKSNLCTLLQSLEISNIEIAVQLSEALDISLDTELEELEKLCRDICLESFYANYCCDYCDGEPDDFITKFNQLKLIEKVQKLKNSASCLYCMYADNDVFIPDYAANLFQRLFCLKIDRNLSLINVKTLQKFALLPKLCAIESYRLVSPLENLSVLKDKLKELIIYGDSTSNCFSVDWMQLERLKKFSFSGSKATLIPEEIGKLTELEVLNLSGNRFKSLPASMSKLQQLKELDLSFNCLKEIPDFIGELKNLELLKLDKNRLEYIPECLLEKEGLKISFSRNPKLKIQKAA